jgi:hypothetical protein
MLLFVSCVQGVIAWHVVSAFRSDDEEIAKEKSANAKAGKQS